MAEPDSAPAKEASPDGKESQQGNGPDAKGEQAKPAKKMTAAVRIALLAGVAVAVVAGGVWGFHYWTTGRFMEDTDDAYVQADSVTIAPKVGGYVEQVLVGNNQDVRAGEPLVRIDPRETRAKAAQSQAQIDVAKANADAMRAQIDEQTSSIAQARAQLASTQASADFANAQAARYAPLARSGAQTQEEFSAKSSQAKQSAMDVASQRAALAGAEKRITMLQAQLRQSESQVESAQAQLAASNLDLQATTIATSIGGRVGDQSVRVGQYVTPGTRLMSVVPLDKLYITANFKETQIGRMRVGQPATVHVDALSGLDLRGRIESISPGTGAEFSLIPPQNATGNFTKIVQRVPVRLSLDASDQVRRLLVPGLSLSVTVDTIGAKEDDRQIRRAEKDRQEAAR